MNDQVNTTFFLHLISFTCWTIVYLDAIRIGFRDKVYCIPFFALALNLTWEIVSLISEFVEMRVINFSIAVWLPLDILILTSYFKFGKKYLPPNVNPKWFIPGSCLVIVIFLFIHLMFIEQFGVLKGRLYSAFIQNLIMSFLFLQMLQARNSTEGQSLNIAVNKLIGTIMVTITYGLIGSKLFNGPNLLLLGLGIGSFIFDSIYVWFLNQVKSKEMQMVKSQYLI